MRLLSCLALLLFVGTADAADPFRHDVLADGHRLALWEKRPASPRGTVLLVHGRTWSALPNFDLQVPGMQRSVLEGFVAAGYAAYGLDLRGYGESARDSTGWLTPDRAAEDVRATLEWIRKANPSLKTAPVLIGYSRGSHVVLLMAQRHPQLLSALVLYGFPSGARTIPPTPSAPPREATTAKAAASDFITPDSTPRAVVDAYVEQAVRTTPIRVDWRDEQQFAFEPARVRVPTLMIYGARDPLYSPENVSKFFGELGTQDRALVLLPDADHAAHLEDPEGAWLDAIVGFLKRPRSPNPGREK